MTRSFITLPLFLLATTTHVFAASADDWKSRSIYQLVTDRFATTASSPATCDSSARKYCGGSWAAITKQLDYIQDLGFDAVWISPIVKNIEGTTAYGEAYHGYWNSDMNSLNSNFGTADDLKALSTALHAKGMYLMVDVVVNHFVADPTNTTDVTPETFDFTTLAPFSAESNYHSQCFISDYNNQTDVEQCWLGDASLPLLDLDTEDSTIVSTMNTWIKNLVSEYSIDGIRIDTAKHVRKDFWPDFVSSAGVFSMGEILSENVTYTGEYTSVLDSVLDYPTWRAITNAFSTTTGSLAAVASTVAAAQTEYKNGEFMTGSFLENHDQPRFQSLTQDQALVKNAMAWPFIQDGIPILYYGQEQAYAGGADPENREALWTTAYQENDKPLVTHVKALNAARKLATSQNSNFLTTALKFIDQSDTAALAVSKPPLLTLLTNGGAQSSTTWTIPSSAGIFSKGESVVDILTCKTLTTDSDGALSVTASSGLPQVLMPASALDSKGTLCTSSATSGAMATLKRMDSGIAGMLSLVALAGLLI